MKNLLEEAADLIECSADALLRSSSVEEDGEIRWDAESDKREYDHDMGVAARLRALVNEPPSLGLLMSMAIRSDHGLGIPGYYDTKPVQFGPSHKQHVESALRSMRQLHEEVVGTGFHSPERDAEYVAIARASGITEEDQP